MPFRFGKDNKVAEEIPVEMSDPTEWILKNTVAEFLLMPGAVLYMCMLGYTFLHGCKVFKGFPKDAAVSYKFVSMVLACTSIFLFLRFEMY